MGTLSNGERSLMNPPSSVYDTSMIPHIFDTICKLSSKERLRQSRSMECKVMSIVNVLHIAFWWQAVVSTSPSRQSATDLITLMSCGRDPLPSPCTCHIPIRASSFRELVLLSVGRGTVNVSQVTLARQNTGRHIRTALSSVISFLISILELGVFFRQ